METIVASEGFVIATCIIITTFMVGWVIFGIGWIRRAAHSLSPTPPTVVIK